MPISVRYRLIQFVPDTLREEARNVAAVLYESKHPVIRVLGQPSAGPIDVTVIKQIVPSIHDDDLWVFAEWASWWQGLAELDEERAEGELDRISETGRFIATDGGVIDNVEPGRIEQAADWLFDRMVVPGDAFDRQIRDVIGRSEIAYRNGFMRNVRQRLGRLELFFPYMIDDTRRVLFKTVRFTSANDEDRIRGVNDAVMSFRAAVKHGFALRRDCFALADESDKQHTHLHRLLSSTATVIDIYDPESWRQVHQATDPART